MAREFRMNKLSPVLFVEAIEPCLGFWVDRLGFAKTFDMPEGARLGFAILVKDGVEIMYQSRASVRADNPAMADMPSCTALYVEVQNLAEIIQRLEGIPVVTPRRTTPYGADEIFVREPGGNVIGFAEHKTQA